MLKQLIQRLLDSRTTPAEAANSAMPSGDNSVQIVSEGTIGTAWTANAFSGVSSFDGYLYFAGTADKGSPTIDVFSGRIGTTLDFSEDGTRMSATLPIAKGVTWRVQGSRLKAVSIALVKALGGGV